jgi:hypothetical protein
MSGVSFNPNPNNLHEDPRSVWKGRNSEPAKPSTSEDELLRVMVKVNDLEAWQQLKDIHSGSIISFAPGEWIVTAQMTNNQLNTIRSKPFVVSLEQGRMVGPTGADSK